MIATRNVGLPRSERILLAASLTYNQRTEPMTATENVRLLDESSDVMFTEGPTSTKFSPTSSGESRFHPAASSIFSTASMSTTKIGTPSEPRSPPKSARRRIIQ